MQLGRVTGTVVATRKEPELAGLKLLLVTPCDADGRPGTDPPIVAADAVGAGVGEVVLYATGSAARHTPMTKDRAVDATIMAIVDQVETAGERRFAKADE